MDGLASFHSKALKDHTTGVLRKVFGQVSQIRNHGVEQLLLLIAPNYRRIVIGAIANLIVLPTTVCIFMSFNTVSSI